MPPKEINEKMKKVRKGKEKDINPLSKTVSVMNSLRFAFSILVTGSTYAEGQQLFLWNDIWPPCKTAFYEAQKFICSLIVKMARASCQYCRSLLRQNSIIAFDGSWSLRKNADFCLVDFIDVSSGRVVDFEIISKKYGPNTFTGPSNAMEVEGIRRMIPRWIHDKRIIVYVHDKDAKSRKLINELGWNITEIIDSNHSVKSLRRKFQKMKSQSTTKLRGLKMPLERFFQCLLRLYVTVEEKKKYWNNAVEHFSGNHQHCMKHNETQPWKDINDGNNREILISFLEKTSTLFDRCDGIHSTQACESLHAVKAHFASKMIAWKSSWCARVCAAILDVNEMYWSLKLYDQLMLPQLNPMIRQKLMNLEEDKWDLRKSRKNEQYKQLERLRRLIKRQTYDKENEQSLYKGVQKKKKDDSNTQANRRKYVLHKMPKVIRNLNAWFKKFGFTGIQDDEEEAKDWEEDEEIEEEEEWLEDFDDEFDYEFKTVENNITDLIEDNEQLII